MDKNQILNSVPVMDPSVETVESTETLTNESLDNKWKIIVWDDDFHTIDYVVIVFMKHFGLTEDVAIQRTLEVHNNGKSVLDRGSKSNMEFHAMIMESQYELTASIEQDL